MQRSAATMLFLMLAIVLAHAQDATRLEGEPIVQTALPYTDAVFKDAKYAHIYPGRQPLLVTGNGGGGEDKRSQLYLLEGGKAQPAKGADGKAIVGNDFLKADATFGGVRGEMADVLWLKDTFRDRPRLLIVNDGVAVVTEQRFSSSDRIYRQAGRVWLVAECSKTTTEGNVTRTDRWVELWYTDGGAVNLAADVEDKAIDFHTRLQACVTTDGHTLLASAHAWRMQDGVFSKLPFLRPPEGAAVKEWEVKHWATPWGFCYVGAVGSEGQARAWRAVDGAAQWISDSDGRPVSHAWLSAWWAGEQLWLVGRDKVGEANVAVLYRLDGGVAKRLELPKDAQRNYNFVFGELHSLLSTEVDGVTSYWAVEGDKLVPVCLPDGTQLSTKLTPQFYALDATGANGHICVPQEGRYRIHGAKAVAIEGGKEMRFSSPMPAVLKWKDWELVTWEDPKDILNSCFGVAALDGKVSALRREKSGKYWPLGSGMYSAALGEDGVYICASVRGLSGPFMLYHLGE